MFSPYYAAARRRGSAEPLDYCAFNIVLTGATRRWCMTERPLTHVQRSAHALQIGPSSLRRDGSGYRFELRERGCPLPQPVRGTVRLQPLLQPGLAFQLDRAGHHLWAPLAPRARIEVTLDAPRLSWCGEAYFDSNRGDRPLEHDFRGWQWSRAPMDDGATVFYETDHLSDAPWPLAVRFADGAVHPVAVPGHVPLPHSGWGIARQACSDHAAGTRLLRTLVDAPFYARSLLRTQLGAESVVTVHESLDLQRFARRWVQWMLPFRMPRYAGRPPGAGG